MLVQAHRITTVLILALGLCGVPGCAGYHMGARSLYPPDVETVYVPIFESKSFRRELGERLTEAVVKEIEKRSTLKVVSTPSADSILSGEIVEDRKRVLVENVDDEARATEYFLSVRVSWIDRRGDLIRQEMSLPVAPELVSISQPSAYLPEGGQSVLTGQMDAINGLAKKIVDLMEVPW